MPQSHPPTETDLRAAITVWRAKGCPPAEFHAILGLRVSKKFTGDANAFRVWQGPKVLGKHPWRKMSDDEILEVLARPRQRAGEHVAIAESLRMLGLDLAAEQELADALGHEAGFQTFSGGTYGFLGLAGFDYGATFLAAYDISHRKAARKVREQSQDAGELVALGWCVACSQAWMLDRELRCPRRHEQESAVLIIPQYLELALTRLQRGRGVREDEEG